jgi:CBS domain-containing protein
MKISECMSDAVEIASPDDPIRSVARTMREIDAGSMPVGENDRLVGMITDRDMAIRAVAEGLGPDTRVREIMSTDLRWCFDDEDVEDVAAQMAEYKVRRLPVLNRDRRLIGMVSLGDLSQADGASSGVALRQISEPGGLHSQH